MGFKNIMMREGNRWIGSVCVCVPTQREIEMDQETERNTLHSDSLLSSCVVLKRGRGQAVIMHTLLWFLCISCACTHMHIHTDLHSFAGVSSLFLDLVMRHPGRIIITSSSSFSYWILADFGALE